MKILIWGFYNQGNIGDDIMALMFHKILSDLGHEPVIYSRSPRFRDLGCATVNNIFDDTFDAIVLGGGAFFKANRKLDSPLEKEVEQLANLVNKNHIPIIGASLGSDGISSINELSPARKAVATSLNMGSVAMRLRSDQKLGLKNTVFLPDIVLTAKYYLSLLSGISIENDDTGSSALINLSRRSAIYYPMALWMTRECSKTSIFLAHSGEAPVGGELTFPFISNVKTDDIIFGINVIAQSDKMLSSKLHPGIIALSFNRTFFPISPRPKTYKFISEYYEEKIIDVQRNQAGIQKLNFLKDFDWQKSVFLDYKNFIARELC